MNRKHIAWIVALALMITGAFTLTGCGGSSKESAEETKEETTTAEEKKDDSAKADSKDQTASAGDQEEAKEDSEDQTASAGDEEKEPEVKIMYTTAYLVMRAKPSQDAEKKGTIPINTKVKVLDDSQDFYLVEYDGKQCYAFGEYLTESRKEAQKAADEAAEQAKQQQQSSSGGYSGGGNAGGGSTGGGNAGGGGGANPDECLTGGVLN